MQPLVGPAIEAVKSGKTRFVPDRFSKNYINWMENLHDWCISRQLWWGHRIPVWYCADCGKMTCTREDPTECAHCGSKNITRDEDVLDTWFSSALWPFETLGWPEKTEDLDFFYPTDVLVTGYDIITFWVSRMIFSGLEHTGETPFHTVLIHGLVRDDKGRKMSKSLGNGIDPLEMIDRFGSDALRMNLVTGNSPGNDMRFYTERCEAMRNFANKIWNASRFVMMNLTIDECRLPEKLELEDKWILSRFNSVVKEVTENLEKYELGVAAQKVYDFIWDNYCDWYIELTKTRLQGEDEDSKLRAQQVLCWVLAETMKLLHPFMPFLTEEIWQALAHEGDFLMCSAWPEYDPAHDFAAEEAEMETVMAAIKAVRTLRAEKNVPPSKKPHLYVETAKTAAFEAGVPFLKKLAYAAEVTLLDKAPENAGELAAAITTDAKLYMPLAELVDVEKELARLRKELQKAENDHQRTAAKLTNEAFISKAPANVVAAEREKTAKLEALIENLRASVANLEKLG